MEIKKELIWWIKITKIFVKNEKLYKSLKNQICCKLVNNIKFDVAIEDGGPIKGIIILNISRFYDFQDLNYYIEKLKKEANQIYLIIEGNKRYLELTKQISPLKLNKKIINTSKLVNTLLSEDFFDTLNYIFNLIR